MATLLETKAQVLETKRGEMAKWFKDHTTDQGEIQCTTAEIKELNDRNDELEALQKEYSDAFKLYQMAEQNRKAYEQLTKGGGNLPPMAGGTTKTGNDLTTGDQQMLAGLSIGKMFTESKAYTEKSGQKGPLTEIPNISLKTVMTTGANGYPPQVLRSGVLIYTPQAQPTLIDLVPMVETTQNGYKYMLETTFTNNAAETAEGSLYPEVALTFTEELMPIRKIPVFVPLTDEQLDDQPGIRDIVDSRLTLMIKQRLNTQMVNGNGTSPNLTGVLNVSGIQTQARGSDTNVDAIYKAMVLIMAVGFADPSGVWMNPQNWQSIRLLKTTIGSYLFGDPSQPGPNTLFGLPIAQHVTIPQGTAIVADWQGYTHLVYRMGIEFEISNSHADFFQRGQLALRAQMRVAFIVYRATAVCTVTSLT